MRDPRLLGIAAGHGAVDLCASTPPVFYPLLASTLGLGYGATSTLMATQTTVSALSQPLFGWLADRFGTRVIAPASVLGAGLAIALLGFAPSYVTVLLVAAMLGLAAGSFHPQAHKAASILGGRWRASALSVHLIAGNTGFALGPLVAATLLLPMGLQSTPLLVLPTALAAAWLLSNARRVDGAVQAHAIAVRTLDHGSIPWLGAFALALVILSRSWMEYGLAAFVPLLYASRGQAPALTGQVLFMVFVMNGPGNVVGGWVADRAGRKPAMVLTFVIMAPLVKLFLDAGGGSSLLAAALIGLLMGVSGTVTILAAQELLPARMGMASGLASSLGTVMGGIGVGAQGMVADRLGLEPAMLILVGVAAVAAVASAALPGRRANQTG